MFEILPVPLLKDNYAYLLHDHLSGTTAVIDPSAAEPVLEVLARKKWLLHFILSTHHHPDHTGGNVVLKRETGCKVIGFEGDLQRIPAIDITCKEGDKVPIGTAEAEVLFIPGHTTGHIAYWFAKEKALFCGDTLFSLGCGRLFEGTAEQLYESLTQLAQLPTDTRVYPGHEYTEQNGRFAGVVEPENKALKERMQEVKTLRLQDFPTIPSTIGQELRTNPFLRTGSNELQYNLGMVGKPLVEVFAELRRRKDSF